METTLADPVRQDLETFIDEWLVETGTPGASLAIVHEGAVVYTGGFGARTLETNAPATPRTRYGIASVTKSFTAMGIQLLAERDRLAIDDPVVTHLPALELGGADGDITLHDLLTHTGGVPSLGTSLVLLYRLTGIDETGIPLGDWEDYLRHLNGATDEVLEEPAFMYWNAGYTLLGKVIEAVDGRTYHRFIQEEILDPLGMERSGFEIETDDGDVMTPYLLEEGEPSPTPFPSRTEGDAAGGLITTVEDLTSYLRVHMEGSVDDVELLSEAALEEAHTGHAERVDSAYGYGWDRSQCVGHTLIGHGGSLGVSSSYLGFTEDGTWGIALAANTRPNPAPPTVAEGILAILTGSEPTTDIPYYARKTQYEDLTGSYTSYRDIVSGGVERRDGLLELTLEMPRKDETILLIPTDDKRPGHTFERSRMSGERETVRFHPHDEHVDLLVDRYRLHKRE